MIRVVLHWAWDPIGVRGIPEAIDEYDSYAAKILEMLETGASDQHIASFLTSVVRDRMELPCKPEVDRDISAMLRELYSIDT